MEGIENIVQVALNSGMSILITCYFLFRDWKYQENLTKILGTLGGAVDRFNATIDTFVEGLINGKQE